MARVIVFVSAAKGVGKTHLSVNLALYLGRLGHGTCLFNADADAAAVCSVLNIHPRHSLKDLIENRVRLENLVVQAVHGIDFFPGCPGIEQLGTLDRGTRHRLHRAIMALNRYDFFIVDTFPGLSRNVVALCKSCPEVVLVMTADARSLTDSYLLLKALSANHFDGSVMLLINKSRDLKVARSAYHRFKEAASRYLPHTLVPLGTVFHDPGVRNAGQARQPFISLFPDSDASKCIGNIARHLSEKKTDDLAVSAFWAQYLENLKHPFQVLGNLQPAHGSADKRAAASTGPGPAPASVPENRLGKKALAGLARLERQLSHLSMEVAGIKETVQAVSERQKALVEAEEPVGTEKLVLDFDRFLEQRKKGAG